jgi:hypothetical protein
MEKKFQSSEKSKEDDILVQIILLVAQAEEALARNDLEETTRCLAEIKKFANTEA